MPKIFPDTVHSSLVIHKFLNSKLHRFFFILSKFTFINRKITVGEVIYSKTTFENKMKMYKLQTALICTVSETVNSVRGFVAIPSHVATCHMPRATCHPVRQQHCTCNYVQTNISRREEEEQCA